MQAGEITLTQLWKEMEGDNFDIISQTLGFPEAQSLETLHALAMSSIDSIDPNYLPEMLLFNMSLKRLGISDTDEIIKQVIVRMTEVNVRKTEDGKILHKKYKAAIDEILENTPAKELLTDAVHKIEEEVRFKYDRTLLHKAAQNGHEEIIKLLFEAGWINVDPVDACNKTPLGFAVVCDNIHAGEELFKHNPDIIREDTTLQPIAQATRNLPLWKDVFIEYAKSHPTQELIPLSISLLGDISGAINCEHQDSQELYDFYQDMHFDVTHIGDVLEN